MSDASQILWVEREARYPRLAELITMPFNELVALAAKDVADETAGSESFTDDTLGEWTIYGGNLLIAENQHAIEQVHVLVAKRSTSLVYESRYKGIIGQVIEPTHTWGINLDADGSMYYWDQQRHSETASLFTLAATECDDIVPNSVAVMLMQEYVACGIYMREHPETQAELGWSTLLPLDLKRTIFSY